jgi:hypothetical protein
VNAGWALSEFWMEKLTISGRYRSSEYSTGSPPAVDASRRSRSNGDPTWTSKRDSSPSDIAELYDEPAH